MKIIETLECTSQILSNSLWQFWNDKSVPFQILFPSLVSWKIIPLYFFGSNNIYFAQKELIKMTIFETFEWSGQILSNSLCQFWNNKSIPLQILYPSSVSWKIIPLYFFSSNNIYFAHKEPIKVKIFETFECSCQTLTNSLCHFLNDKLIPLQILYPSTVSWKITPLYFLAQAIYTLLKRSTLKSKFLRLSIARVKIHQISRVNFEMTSHFLFHSLLSWHITSLWILSSYFSYFGLKDPISIPILRLSIALVKISYIPHVIFQTTSQFFFKFCITLQCHER